MECWGLAVAHQCVNGGVSMRAECQGRFGTACGYMLRQGKAANLLEMMMKQTKIADTTLPSSPHHHSIQSRVRHRPSSTFRLHQARDISCRDFAQILRKFQTCCKITPHISQNFAKFVGCRPPIFRKFRKIFEECSK